jgi:hypothetical protein
MSPKDELEYFRIRAQVERSLAEDAGDTIAGQIHKELAERYEGAIERTERRRTLHIVSPSAAEGKRPLSTDRADASARGR